MIKRRLYYFLPPSIRLIVRRLYNLPIDLFEKVTGRRDTLTPPRGLIFVGSGDFKKSGQMLLGQIKSTCELKSDSFVLDIGCGIGRLAVPLTEVLNEKGKYEGFDIVKRGVKWCQKNISKRYPNFNFTHIDLKNDLYNLKTNKEAKDFVFPYEDEQFDLVILTSVFTHMMPPDVDNYLKEIHRVLKPDGKCFATYFLLNDEIKTRIETQKQFNFPYNFDTYSLMDKNVKEANIAFEEDYLKMDLLSKNNLVAQNTFYGWWSGRPESESLGYQDTIILKKKN